MGNRGGETRGADMSRPSAGIRFFNWSTMLSDGDERGVRILATLALLAIVALGSEGHRLPDGGGTRHRVQRRARRGRRNRHQQQGRNGQVAQAGQAQPRGRGARRGAERTRGGSGRRKASCCCGSPTRTIGHGSSLQRTRARRRRRRGPARGLPHRGTGRARLRCPLQATRRGRDRLARAARPTGEQAQRDRGRLRSGAARRSKKRRIGARAGAGRARPRPCCVPRSTPSWPRWRPRSASGSLRRLPRLPVPSVLEVIQDSARYISAPLDEVDLAKLRVGQDVRATLDAYRGQLVRRHPSSASRPTSSTSRSTAERSRSRSSWTDRDVRRGAPPGHFRRRRGDPQRQARRVAGARATR